MQSRWVELHTANGGILHQTQADSDGIYSFHDPLTILASTRYFVVPVLERNQYGDTANVQTNVWGSVSVPLTIQGVPTDVHVHESGPGVFVLITTAAYAGPKPPTINPNVPVCVYSSTTDESGNAILFVPGGSPYFITCWKPTLTGATMTYARSASLQLVNDQGAATNFRAQTTITGVTCPL